MPLQPLPSIGLVFGVFDCLHPGHHFFLREAAARCQTLVVVITPDHIVEVLKKRQPLQKHTERTVALQTFDAHFRVVSGDSVLGTWKVIHEHQPDIFLLGYDQEALGEALEIFPAPKIFLDSFHPEKYKSGLLNKTKNSL